MTQALVVSSVRALDTGDHPFSVARTTTNTSETFCPSCGNRTLYKVSVVVDEGGRSEYRPLTKKQFSRKGLRVCSTMVALQIMQTFGYRGVVHPSAVYTLKFRIFVYFLS